jgi:hypothetical protein
MKLAHIADKVAADIYTRPMLQFAVCRDAVIRDAADFATGGDLSTSMLDRLCDMVARRLAGPVRYGLLK